MFAAAVMQARVLVFASKVVPVDVGSWYLADRQS